MAGKKYSKKKLAFFKKHIKAKLKNLTDDLDDSRGNLESDTQPPRRQERLVIESLHPGVEPAVTDQHRIRRTR